MSKNENFDFFTPLRHTPVRSYRAGILVRDRAPGHRKHDSGAPGRDLRLKNKDF